MSISISKTVENRSGVYAIWNVARKKIYIGSSNNIKKRINHHITLLENGKHPIKELQKDFDSKHKFVCFSVCYVLNNDDLRTYEKKAAKLFNAFESGYNTQSICASDHNEREREIILKANNYMCYYDVTYTKEDRKELYRTITKGEQKNE